MVKLTRFDNAISKNVRSKQYIHLKVKNSVQKETLRIGNYTKIITTSAHLPSPFNRVGVENLSVFFK